jgi:hypothetical protein
MVVFCPAEGHPNWSIMMSALPPLPDLPGFFKDLLGVLHLANLVRHAVMMVRTNFPVRGEQQHPGRGHEGEYVLLRVLDVFLRVEQVLFDLEQVITTKSLAAPFPSNLIHGLVLSPVEVRAFAAFLSMLEEYDALVAHLGWRQVIRPPFDRGAQPWPWPDAPPVEPALLVALDAAAEELLVLLDPPSNTLLEAMAGGSTADPPAVPTAAQDGDDHEGSCTSRKMKPPVLVAEVMPAAAHDDGDKQEPTFDHLTASPVREVDKEKAAAITAGHIVRALAEATREGQFSGVFPATVPLGAPPPEVLRLRFDDASLTVVIDDGKPIGVKDPKAYQIFKVIANAAPNIVPRKTIQNTVAATRGDRTIRKLLLSLPEPLRTAWKNTTRGYYLRLPAKKKNAARGG